MKAVLAFLLVLGSLAVIHGQSRPRPRPSHPHHRPRSPRSLPHPVRAWNCSEGPQLYGARQIDGGMGKVVVLDKGFRIWVTKNISPTSCGTSGWAVMPGSRTRIIEVPSDGKVFGMNTTGKIYHISGTSKGRKQNTGWVNVPMYMPIRRMSYDLCNFWIVTTSGLLMKCSQ
ncbi:fish-egg lectin-like [Paralichthys olivaceus]|uniref:fish-egg lectin-like n=1 Tax=Paralichthys olivaceus TaxID=8255 RepID=UPI0037508409